MPKGMAYHNTGGGGGGHGRALNEKAKKPAKGVAALRSDVPKRTQRAPSENWTYRRCPKGKGGSNTTGSV